MTWKKRCMLVAVFSLTLGLWAQAHAVAPTMGCAANGLTPAAPSVYAADAEDGNGSDEAWQIIIGDPIIIGLGSKGSKAVWLCQPNGIFAQYYDTSSWGHNIWLNGIDPAERFSTPYYDDNIAEGAVHSMVVAGNTTTVTTEMLLSNKAVLNQIVTYEAGSYSYNMRWELKNVSGAALSDVRFFHGGDTYFGDSDRGYTWYNENSSMVYVTNPNFAVTGIMGFQASALTPSNHFFGGLYSTGYSQANSTGLLLDTTQPAYIDAGYQLEWDRATLANNATWIIEATELFTDPTAIAVTPPANQQAVKNITATLNFVVQNLHLPPGWTPASDDSFPHELALIAQSAQGWNVSIVGTPTVTLESGDRATVQVQVVIPASANAGDVDTITVTATDTDDTAFMGSSSSQITVYSNTYSLSETSLDFSASTGGSRRRTITLRNTPPATREGVVPFAVGPGPAPVVIGQVGGSDPLEAPFSFGTDTCSNQEIASGEECTIEVIFAPETEGEFTDSFNVPVLSPVAQNWTVDVFGSTTTPDPVTRKLYDEKINYGCFIDTLLR